MNRLFQLATIAMLRPYISREFPGWGKLYSWFIGDYRVDPQWAWLGTRWIRGKLHGYELLVDLGHWSSRQTFFLERYYDLPTQLLVKRLVKDGNTFVDVGANQGAISLLASRIVGSEGRVFAFEPNPKPRSTFNAMIERNHITNITLIPAGLGREAGTFQLTVPRINSGEGTFGKSHYRPEDVGVVECKVCRGDTILDGVSPALIKIDVEGFELQVLLGLTSLISRCHPPIVMEMVASALASCDTLPSDIVAFMEGHGYRAYCLRLTKRCDLEIVPIEIGADVNADVLWMTTPPHRTLSQH